MKAAPGPIPLARSKSLAVAKMARQEVHDAKWSFLVATLRAAAAPPPAHREPACTNELVDSRMRLLETCAAIDITGSTRVRTGHLHTHSAA